MKYTQIETSKLLSFVKVCKQHVANVDSVDCSNPDKAVDLLAHEMNVFDEALYNFLRKAMKLKDPEILKL